MNHALIANLSAATEEAASLAERSRQIRVNLAMLEERPENLAHVQCALAQVMLNLASSYVLLAGRIQEIEP